MQGVVNIEDLRKLAKKILVVIPAAQLIRAPEIHVSYARKELRNMLLRIL